MTGPSRNLLTAEPDRNNDRLVTNTENPFQVGRVVYPTLTDAENAKANAQEIYPEAVIKIVDRRTGQVVG